MILTVAVRGPRDQSSALTGGNKEVGSGVGKKLTTVQPATEGCAGRLSVLAGLGDVVAPAVVSGVLPVVGFAVPAWLLDLHAANAKAMNSTKNSILRGIRFSFREILTILPVKPG